MKKLSCIFALASVALLSAIATAGGPRSISPFKAAQKSSSNSFAEWIGYSNGVAPSGTGNFTPDAGYKSLHIDTIDVAFNGPFQEDENAVLVITLNFNDGTSGSTAMLQYDAPQAFETLAATDWNFPPGSNGKRIKSVTYGLSSNGLNSAVVAIIQANGFEY